MPTTLGKCRSAVDQPGRLATKTWGEIDVLGLKEETPR